MKDHFAQRPGERDLEYAYRMKDHQQKALRTITWMCVVIVIAIIVCVALAVVKGAQ